MTDSYIEFCEVLWRDWLTGRLDLPLFVQKEFDLNAAPEPYIAFGAGASPMIALTTNPGATMPHQCRAAVQEGCGPLKATDDYASAARALGEFYERELAGPAKRRTGALRALSALVGSDGVLQVEACPFHSRSLPKKGKLLRTIAEGGLLQRYTETLLDFLRPRPVVIVSAVSTRTVLGPKMVLSPWVAWKAELAGLDANHAEFVPLVVKGTKTTAAALFSSANGIPKSLVLMMGGNHLPAQRGLETLANALQGRPAPAGYSLGN